jgi:hypothetical protein
MYTAQLVEDCARAGGSFGKEIALKLDPRRPAAANGEYA